ncbi:COG4223 family protein [Xanthobacter agilis]|uniref:Mitochondrial inner membrane protein n=1 Tax=Xanthobacter agilis TaxID=47492 RepID=A0ABU0LIL7_XANAG|nr:hypothetical protein [Xanthobacter agilis]MDQ0506979.1 hypothetical protein [Xanthobacter agilis]
MASDNPTAAGGSSRRPRTPPTLDLKAEEVRSAPDSTPDAGAAPAADSPAAAGASEAGVPITDGSASEAAVSSAPEASASSADDAAPEVALTAGEQGAGEQGAESPSTATATPPSPAAPRRGGAGTVIAALVLGALAGGGAGGGVLYYAMQHAPQPAPVGLSPLTARLSVLEARPVADPAALAALRQSLGQADARFAALDSALAALKAAPASAGAGAAATAPNVDALKAALAKTEAAVADVASRVDVLKTSQDTLKSAQDGLQASVAAANAAAQQAQGQAQQLGPRLDGLTAHIDAVRKEAIDAASAAAAINRGAAAVLVLGTLKQSIDAGRPYGPELEAARALLGPRAAPLEPFAALAQTGFPPLPKLADQLAVAGDAAIDGLTPAPEAPAADASLMTRFLASAQSLVKVRPADGMDPDSLRGVLKRAVADVQAGNLDTAQATLKQLPAPVQQKLAAVVGEIDARRRAAEAAATLYQQALAAISGKAP